MWRCFLLTAIAFASPPDQLWIAGIYDGADGEQFSADLHTGTGNFAVPLALPPGRNGFQPQLNLIYSSGNGNGPFGLGWALSFPGVSCKTSKGIPRYDETADVFILFGAEDLVAVEKTAPVYSALGDRIEDAVQKEVL